MALAWCPWSEWSTCSLQECNNGVSKYHPKYDDSRSPKSSLYCLENSTKSDLIFRVADDGSRSLISPKARRQRICSCKSLDFIKVFFQEPCQWKSLETSCRECDFDTNSNELRLCSDVLRSNSYSNLYHIIGGALGALAFVLLCIFCIRFALTDSNRRRRRRVADSLPSVNHQSGLPVGPNFPPIVAFSPFASEMPPAYKDVVPLTSRQEQNRVSLSDTSTPLADLRTLTIVQNVNTNDEYSPPPSYQEVIASAPTGYGLQNHDSAFTPPSRQNGMHDVVIPTQPSNDSLRYSPHS